ncbi:uncharacterized protein LOC132935520 [Metopolophium dirhodum]|uniref:uncharacterized protein LOC132935520 n=1 Tax=Metopolophium dirhodum TaxID=44670 RepID=UPI00298FB300|nr:uncharacterized protein LOC132935520 [Metopolophium dirhodum]
MGLDEIMQAQVKEVRKKRGIIKASLTRMKNFLEGFDLTTDAISLLEFRQEELPRLNQKFDDIQTQLELIVVDDCEKKEEERNKFEFDYFSIRSRIQEIVNARKINNSSSHNSTFNTSVGHSRAQLPIITLPVFAGDIQDWESFFDCFRAMIHDDGGFTPAQKFYYLRSSVSGQALDLIKSVPMTDTNYEVAIERLKQRYDNRSLVIQSHIRSLLESPYVEQPRAKDLQALHAHVSTHVAALKALDQPTEHWDAWLVTIIVSRLDSATSHGWQLRQHNTQLPKYCDLEQFLASRCIAFESSEATSGPIRDIRTTLAGETAKKSNAKNVFPETRRSLVASSNTVSCQYCTDAHKLYHCEKFKAATINTRLSFVQEKRMCFNCLTPGHMANVCRSTYSCRTCNRKHHSLLHQERQQQIPEKEQLENKQPDISQQLSTSGVVVSAPVPVNTTAENSHVFLATALVMVQDKNGGHRQCRAILDSGSQVNFVSKRYANLLQLACKTSSLPISGIGDNRLKARSCSELKIESRTSDFSIKISCYVLPNIVGNLASCPEPADGWKIPGTVSSNLADPDFHRPQSVDLLIGGGSFFNILGTTKIPLNIGSVTLYESNFGWLVTGELPKRQTPTLLSIGQTIEEDWKVLGIVEDTSYGRTSRANKRSQEELETVQHFKQYTIRDEEGRFVVRLPIKETISEIGETLPMAIARFLNVEKRLQHDEHLKNKYIRFMNEYIKMGHMVEVLENSVQTQKHFYLPHHSVIKASSLTTKVRVVFDASAKSASGVSLNDVLKCGPTVQQDLFSILVRFRKHQFVLTSDIEKMFRQIKIAREDWDLQRIVWRSSPKELLRLYQLTTVTYGMTPASFLSTYCLIELAKSAEKQFPCASKVIAEDFYMDDLMTGADTEDDCCQLQREVSTVLDSAKLPLRKWCSNSEFVLQNMSKCVNDPLFVLDIGDDDTVKSLGLQWKPIADLFQFEIVSRSMEGTLTKRAILSDLNRIFDPLGFLSPVLVKGKIFLQQLWSMKIDWDARLPLNIQERWGKFYEDLERLKYLSIPRKAIPERTDIIDVHGFCDASEEAYAACIYIRSQSSDGKWHSRLLCAKTRVAPLKGNTIPRLELNGALLLTELAQRVADSWQINIHQFKLWTDSTIVLGWLNSQSSRLKIYVANRVAQIMDITEVSQWNHIGTQENPADIPSRGLRPRELLAARLWWNGPTWLESDEKDWILNPITHDDELPEVRKVKLVLLVIKPLNSILEHYSEWNCMLRGVAWLTVYSKYMRKKINGPQSLTISDLDEARKSILRMVQAECFSKEISSLERGLEVPRNSKLRSLNPFLRDGLILVGGRLENSDIADGQKHPIVLPASHKITRLIFEAYHLELLHGGPQLMLSEVRRLYWPLLGRVTARSVVWHCVKCTKARPRFNHPIMAPLPRDRVQCTRPFTVTGVDFAGPIYIRSGLRRVAAKKAWIAIFVCFSTKAIHLELADDLSSKSFMATFRCFMARRGKCAKVFSDNGTNFVGAQKELISMMKKASVDLEKEGIEWHFNPPSAPHFGGIWESAVKSMKHHMKRVISDHKLTNTEMRTLLCQIEACLNSRPMTPLNSDPSDLAVLTPSHFLIGGAMLLPDEPDISKEEPNGLRRWQLVQNLMQTFWKRWSREYLPQTQIRGKWTSKSAQLAKNDVVIIKDDCMPPARWKLGLVMELHPGSDGVVRVVTIRTANGTLMRRPVIKLCRLPTEKDNSSVENQDFQRGENVAAATVL